MTPEISSAKQENSIASNVGFKQALRDVVDHIQIMPDLTILYHGYKPLDAGSHLRRYLQKTSLADRNQYLVAKLQRYLYSIFSLDFELDIRSSIEDSNETEKDRQIVANNVEKWSRTKFYQRLAQSNHGQGYSDPNWVVTKQERKHWRVTKNGLTLHINPERHLVKTPEVTPLDQLVSIKMPPSVVDHGKYIAMGDAGSPDHADVSQNSIVTQLYFNVSADGAVILMDSLTQKLNALKIPFSFNVLYDEAKFCTPNSAILELLSCDFELVNPFIKSIYQQNKNCFKLEVLFFCKKLAPGLGLAEKPLSKNFPQENIGQYYSKIIAKALVKIWRSGHLTNIDKLDTVLSDLSNKGVNLNHLYLNPNSTDIYEFNSE
jgi:hypothetical protein